MTGLGPVARLSRRGLLLRAVRLHHLLLEHNRTGDPGSTHRYSWSRLTRIFLPYLPIGVALGVAYGLYPQLAGAHQWNWFSTLTLLPSVAQPALAVAWTLQHEMVFYGLTLLLLLTKHVRLGCSVWLLAIVGAQWFGVGHIPGLSLIDVEFIMGMAVAWCFLNGRGGPSAILLGAGLGCCVVALMIPDPNARLLFGAGIALLLLPALRAEASGRLRVVASAAPG